MNETVVLSGAEQDLFAVYCGLEKLQDELGESMNMDFLKALELLSVHPFMGSRYQGKMRRWHLKDWNLGIFYCVEGGRNIVVAVQHLKQSPKRLRSLLRKRLPR